MSTASLLQFLTGLERELLRSSKDYRYFTADRRELTFYYSSNKLVKQTEKELSARGIRLTNKDWSEISAAADELLEDCRTEAKRLDTKDRSVKIQSNQYYISVVLGVSDTGKNRGTFDNLKKIYRNGLQDFTDFLIEFLEKKGEILTKISVDPSTGDLRDTGELVKLASELYEGGHSESTGVFETRARDAIKAGVSNYEDLSESIVLDDLETLGVRLQIVRKDSKDTHEVSIQSRIDNQLAGVFTSKQKARLQNDLKKAITKLTTNPLWGPGLADLKGSRSLREKKLDQSIDAVMVPMQKVASKNSAITAVKQKTKSKEKGSRSTRIDNDAKNNKQKKRDRAKVRVRNLDIKNNSKKAPSDNYLSLMTLLNTKLPEVVRKNMGPPGLSNRTGKFASSVRVTEIIQTPKGFPSVGYTYQKNPYQVFEMGVGNPSWSSEKRDPRKVIDQSIREIAANLAIGRFFTRRV